jgi:hypothetical protein
VDSLVFVSYAATTLGCRLGGAALFIGLGSVALFSRQIADALFQRPDLITDRRPPSAERGESRRLYAKIARWGLLVWGGFGAVSGLLALTGVAHCA